MKRKPVMFGISGPKLTAEEEEFFITHPVEGFILFKRNIETEEQLKTLVENLKKLYNNEYVPLIFIDQEGGRVARVKPPISLKLYPSAEELAKSDETTTQANYKELMEDLKRFGIDSPTCPVSDLRHIGAHDVIGDRSFGPDVKEVVKFSTAAINGIIEADGIPVIKHMPGHGRALCDSHNNLPIIKTPIDELEKTDFAVFRELSKLPNNEKIWGMTAHIVVQALDPEKPATLSKIVIDYIREVIGFKGRIITDAIEMGALHEGVDNKLLNLAKVAHGSIEAGCDVVLHCTGDLQEMKTIWDSIRVFNRI